MIACTCMVPTLTNPWSGPPQNHGPEIPLCNHFYVLFYSPMPRQDHGSERVQTMVPDHGFVRVGTMQVQAIMPPSISGLSRRAQKSAKGRKNCKQPRLKQPGLERLDY